MNDSVFETDGTKRHEPGGGVAVPSRRVSALLLLLTPPLATLHVGIACRIHCAVLVEELQVVSSTRHVHVEPGEALHDTPAVLGRGVGHQLKQPGDVIGEAVVGARVVLLSGRRESPRVLHADRHLVGGRRAVQHADLIDDGALQEIVLVHQARNVVQLRLELPVAPRLLGLAVERVEVEPDEGWAAARGLGALAALRVPAAAARGVDELLGVLQVVRYQRGREVLVALPRDGGRSLPPIREYRVHALLAVPHVGEGLAAGAALERPEAHARGLGELPAVAVSGGVGLRRRQGDVQIRRGAVARTGLLISARGRALAEHVSHAAAFDVRLVRAEEYCCHLRGAGMAVGVQEVRHPRWSEVLLLHGAGAPDLRHEDEVLREELLPVVCAFGSEVPVPVADLAEGAAGLDAVDEPLRLGHRHAVRRDARDLAEEAAPPDRVVVRGHELHRIASHVHAAQWP
mmetsp:Transcript_60175/g.160883  ORF Transcript_60175/g.160883 Transcript_60175/m.160883 type:complete len:459 (-) Transcript_60175:299-1675(-)